MPIEEVWVGPPNLSLTTLPDDADTMDTEAAETHFKKPR